MENNKTKEYERPADVPYEKYIELEIENKTLKEIIIDLSEKVLFLEKELKRSKKSYRKE